MRRGRFGLLVMMALTIGVPPVSAQGFKVPVDYFTLPNGLKVVVSEDHSAPVALVEVIYNIGFRVEPKGRTGFAHLFEHMMFQGSAQVKKMEHVSLMQEAGGIVNGSTRFDYTNYFQALPVNALERAIWLEADRMRSLDVSVENLKNQQNVVSEEVRVNVLNQPHASFEWLEIWERANTNWHNAHNFYGDLSELEAATLDDVRNFFKTYYAPNNAVLVVVGDTTAAEVRRLAERHFASIPRQPLPPPRRRLGAAADGDQAVRPAGQAGAHAGDGGGLAPAAADVEGLLRAERARPAAEQRRQRAHASQARARGSPGDVHHRRLQLPGQQLGHEGPDALHDARRLPGRQDRRPGVDRHRERAGRRAGERHLLRRARAGEEDHPLVVPRRARRRHDAALRPRQPARRLRVVRRRPRADQHDSRRAREGHRG